MKVWEIKKGQKHFWKLAQTFDATLQYIQYKWLSFLILICSISYDLQTNNSPIPIGMSFLKQRSTRFGHWGFGRGLFVGKGGGGGGSCISEWAAVLRRMLSACFCYLVKPPPPTFTSTTTFIHLCDPDWANPHQLQLCFLTKQIDLFCQWIVF